MSSAASIADLLTDVLGAVERHVGQRIETVRLVTRGYTSALRATVRFRSGTSAFVKAEAPPRSPASGCAAKPASISAYMDRSCRACSPGSTRARFRSWCSKILPMLSGPRRGLGSAFGKSSMRSLRSSLADPRRFLRGSSDIAQLRDGWREVARATRTPLSLEASERRRWLDAALPALLAGDPITALRGDVLVHADIRSDNICFIGNAVKLIDWNWGLHRVGDL